jgi:hypothetical protein
VLWERIEQRAGTGLPQFVTVGAQDVALRPEFGEPVRQSPLRSIGTEPSQSLSAVKQFDRLEIDSGVGVRRSPMAHVLHAELRN